MIKGVLFDFDCTLLDRVSSLNRFIVAQHERLAGLQHVDKQQFVSRFTELDAHGHVWKDSVYRTLVSEFGISGLTWQELLDDYTTEFCRYCLPFPDVVSTLSSLHAAGVPLAIISNARSPFQRSVIRALDIERFFDAILISQEEGVRKPEREIFWRALERLGVSPEESVFVGDHPISDIAGAHSAGMKTIWLRNSIWPPPERVDAIIDRLSDLPVVIQGIP